jgi:hypothetical protein
MSRSYKDPNHHRFCKVRDGESKQLRRLERGGARAAINGALRRACLDNTIDIEIEIPIPDQYLVGDGMAHYQTESPRWLQKLARK